MQGIFKTHPLSTAKAMFVCFTTNKVKSEILSPIMGICLKNHIFLVFTR